MATVLIDHLHALPDAKPRDDYWMLSQLVNRRNILVKDGIRLKNGLHEQVSIVYPSYDKFFSEIDGKSAMYFWKTYPLPMHLQGKLIEELTEEIPSFILCYAEIGEHYLRNDEKWDGIPGTSFRRRTVNL